MTSILSPQSTLFSLAELPLPPKSENTLAAKAMRCKISIRQWDGYKYDRQVSEEIADLHSADKDSGRFRKRLLPRSALQEITAVVSLARRRHALYTLPWGDDEYRILPSAAYFEHAQEMRELESNFRAAVSHLESGFERLVRGHSGLGTMFKVEDYPGMRDEGGVLCLRFPNELRECFSFETKILPMTDGEDFRAAVGDEERERIRRQIADSVSAALRLATRELWQRLFEPVSHMAKRLAEFSAAEAENKPKLYDSMITNIVEVLDVLPKLNLESDSSLEQMADEIRRELIVERKELRKFPDLCAEKARKAAEISRRMEAYIGFPSEMKASLS